MRPYPSRNGDECIEHIAFPTKHTNQVDTVPLPPKRNLIRASSTTKCTKWIIADALLIFSLTLGCTYFCYTNATSSARELSAKLQEDQIIELSWTRQHVEELEGAFDFQRDQRRLLDAQHIKDLELDLELEHIGVENVRLEIEIVRARNERMSSELLTERTSTSSEYENNSEQKNEESSTGSLRGTPAFKYQEGDIVEFADPLSPNFPHDAEGHLLAPHMIQSSKRYGTNTIYDVVCSVDGRKKGLPEKYLRPYVPYKKDTKAMCNMGSLDLGKFSECTVVEYKPKAERGVMVLQGRYSVVVGGWHGGRRVSLPVWKVERLP